jgi:Fe-S-cluster-containing hydrogenase component 2
MEPKFIVADPEKCTGCRLCELVCSAVKEKGFNPILSRIRTVRIEPISNISMACRLCEDPPCVNVCPRDALSQEEDTGRIMIDEDKCDGCKWCLEACEFGAILIHPDKKIATICDLCDGEPKCVEMCPKEALELLSTEELSQRMRKATFLKLLRDLKS